MHIWTNKTKNKSIINQYSIWIGEKSELVLDLPIENKVSINEINTINVNIKDPHNNYLRSFNITVSISHSNSYQLIGTFFSDWKGDCEIELSINKTGDFLILFDFKGKDQFSPILENISIAAEKTQTHFVLDDYNFQQINNQDFLIIVFSLLTENNEPVTNSTVLVFLKNSPMELVTDNLGKINFSIPIQINDDMINITLIYLGDESRASSNYGPHFIPVLNNLGNLRRTQNSFLLSFQLLKHLLLY